MENKIYKLLEEEQVSYEKLIHHPLFTAEDTRAINGKMEGTICKNLFLRDDQNKFYLLTLDAYKRLDVTKLRKILHVHKLHFATEEELLDILKLTKGSISPFGLLNDTENKCQFLMEEDLISEKILIHSEGNTETISLTFKDLANILNKYHHPFISVDI